MISVLHCEKLQSCLSKAMIDLPDLTCILLPHLLLYFKLLFKLEGILSDETVTQNSARTFGST